jgi:hypothetical protein
VATPTDGAASGETLDHKTKTFGLFSMVLFSVSAILLADTVATSAASGVQGLSFWIILGFASLVVHTFATFGILASTGIADMSIVKMFFALSSIVFLTPYLLRFPALLVLRREFPDQPRPCTVPGGAVGAWVNTIRCETGIILTLFLFFYFPVEDTSKAAFWAITGGGTIISLLIGWWLHWQASRKTAA